MAFCYVSHQCDEEADRLGREDARQCWVEERTRELLAERGAIQENIDAAVGEYAGTNVLDALAMAIQSSDQRAQDGLIRAMADDLLYDDCCAEAEEEADSRGEADDWRVGNDY